MHKATHLVWERLIYFCFLLSTVGLGQTGQLGAGLSLGGGLGGGGLGTGLGTGGLGGGLTLGQRSLGQPTTGGGIGLGGTQLGTGKSGSIVHGFYASELEVFSRVCVCRSRNQPRWWSGPGKPVSLGYPASAY